MTERPWLKFYEPGVKKQLVIPEVGLSDIFNETVNKYSNQIAIVFNDKSLTYSELNTLVNRFAKGLKKAGFKHGDKIALYLPNSLLWIIAYFSILRLGSVVVQVNPLFSEPELKQQLIDSESAGIITAADFLSRINFLDDELGNLKIVLEKDINRLLYDEELDDNELEQPNVRPSADSAVIQYTAGTTSVPNGVMFSHRNLIANAIQLREWIQGIKEREVIFTSLPLYNVYSLTTALHLSVFLGGTIIVNCEIHAESILQHIEKYLPTIFLGTPSAYIALNNYPSLDKFDLSSIKLFLNGISPLPKGVAQRFKNLTGSNLIETYNLNETSPVTHINPPNLNKLGSIGIPIPNTDAKIVDLNNSIKSLTFRETGELVISGDQIMLGYWGKDSPLNKGLRDGWLYTGEIAYMDEDGFFYILNSKKDIIISAGCNIYPKDIEEVLYEHPAVSEAVCIGIPDLYWGESIKAYVIIDDKFKVTKEELLNFCRYRLSANKVPKIMELREVLPRTTNGKVSKRMLIEEEVGKRNNYKDIFIK